MSALQSFAGGAMVVGSSALVWVVTAQLRGITGQLPRLVPAAPSPHGTFDTADAYLVVSLACTTCRAFHVPHEDDQRGAARCVQCGTRRSSSIGEAP